jgi:hypothetical protein
MPVGPVTVGSERRRGGIHGHIVKTMNAIKLHVAIVLLLASNSRGPARVVVCGVGVRGIEVGEV